MILLTIVVFAAILGLLVFVHELGHFVMAKRAGMKVEEFGFGFPPRLFGIRRGETIYSINLIPLGGFVRILGEDGGEESTGDPRSFGSKGFWPRLAVLLAGVGMNFILAWFLIFIGIWLFGTPAEVGDPGAFAGGQVLEENIAVVAVQPDSPAQDAGFRAGDVIVSINGVEFNNVTEMIEYSNSHAGEEVLYELRRGEETIQRTVVPRVDPPEGSGAVGFAPAKIGTVKYPFFTALKFSFSAFASRVWGILSAFWLLLSTLFARGEVIDGLSGPVGIAVLTRDFTRLGFPYLNQFAAVLSINLAIINAFPFPALDGGRVLFLIIEKIRGVRSMKWEQVANTAGFFLLILLMIVVTVGDVGRYSEQFKRLFQNLL